MTAGPLDHSVQEDNSSPKGWRMTVEDRLAEYIAQLRYEDLSEEALGAVERLFLDTASAMLSGFADAECRDAVDRLLRSGGLGPFTVVGHPGGADSSIAVLANGMFADWCQSGLAHAETGIHGGAVIFPVLLAAAEAYGLTEGDGAGREFVTTAVATYDVAVRISEAMNANSPQGRTTTGVAASIAAAGGAARLMGLDVDGILSAMGIAATGGGLSRQSFADRVNGKKALCGMAAKSAMDAGRMAGAGIAGAPNFFTGSHGISAVYVGGKADLAPLLGDLGQHFSILDVAAHPSCGSANILTGSRELLPANVLVFAGERKAHGHGMQVTVAQPAAKNQATVLVHAQVRLTGGQFPDRNLDRMDDWAGKPSTSDEKVLTLADGVSEGDICLLRDAARDLRYCGPAAAAEILRAARSTSSAA
jgi:hypothetical protein